MQTRGELRMKGPRNPGAFVLTMSFLCLVAALGWIERHDLTGTTSRRGYPVWLMLVVLSVLSCVGLVHAWRKGPGDHE